MKPGRAGTMTQDYDATRRDDHPGAIPVPKRTIRLAGHTIAAPGVSGGCRFAELPRGKRRWPCRSIERDNPAEGVTVFVENASRFTLDIPPSVRRTASPWAWCITPTRSAIATASLVAHLPGPSTVSTACMIGTLELMRQYCFTFSAFSLNRCVSIMVFPCLPL